VVKVEENLHLGVCEQEEAEYQLLYCLHKGYGTGTGYARHSEAKYTEPKLCTLANMKYSP
jgi:ribulose bisphosphate carboxylase small subunit